LPALVALLGPVALLGWWRLESDFEMLAIAGGAAAAAAVLVPVAVGAAAFESIATGSVDQVQPLALMQPAPQLGLELFEPAVAVAVLVLVPVAAVVLVLAPVAAALVPEPAAVIFELAP